MHKNESSRDEWLEARRLARKTAWLAALAVVVAGAIWLLLESMIDGATHCLPATSERCQIVRMVIGLWIDPGPHLGRGLHLPSARVWVIMFMCLLILAVIAFTLQSKSITKKHLWEPEKS